jgi:hypothetical protein
LEAEMQKDTHNDLALLIEEAKDSRGDERSKRIVELFEGRIIKWLNRSRQENP